MQRVISFIVIGIFFAFAASEKCFEDRDRGDNSCGETGGLRFYYDKTTKHCQPFFYNGCGGTANRFATTVECREACSNVTVTSSGHSMVITVPKCAGDVRAAVGVNLQPLTCEACPSGYSCAKNLCCPSKEAVCDVDYDAGKFAFQGSHTPRYFYSKSAKSCLLFTYYGALGNANNFETFSDCMNFCNN